MVRRSRGVLWGVLLVAVSGVGANEEAIALDPHQPCTGELANPVTYNIRFDLVFTPKYRTGQARVWMVRPSNWPGQTVADYIMNPSPMSEARDPLYGNPLLYFEFDHPMGAQIIHQSYRLTNYEIYWHIDPSKIIDVQEYPPSFAPYLRSEQQVVVNDEIRELAHNIVQDAKNPYEKAQKVMIYVMEALTYGHDRCSLRASSLHALIEKRGHCSDYHGFCTALLRAVGVPARVVYGMSPIEAKKASPSHCKLEVYLAPYGWVSFDVAETDKVLTKLEQDPRKSAAEKESLRHHFLSRLFRGFKDNTWYRLAAGTDYPLVPAPAGNPPLIRTAYIECDGEALPDPDPSNPDATLFAWHLLIEWNPDRQVTFAWDY